MRIVAFVHQKGGTGKTTLAIGTAIALAETGARVLLVDADVQGTASEWGRRWGQRWNVVCRSQMQPIIHEQTDRFERMFDWMIVDGPPNVSEMTASIFKAADGILIPIRPSLPDIWALENLAALHERLTSEGNAGLSSWCGIRLSIRRLRGWLPKSVRCHGGYRPALFPGMPPGCRSWRALRFRMTQGSIFERWQRESCREPLFFP